ncbi:unnamed protein product [Lymnaea stagnalis]|uniref:TGF-beta family profile domain-containing protein n=1 Tax=Lymnaea stagnalis TaxID=6523 RepID=A0AAV2HE01_LYMST
MKSALLRMRVNVQKNLLDHDKNGSPKSVTVSLYVKRIADTDNAPIQDSHSVFVGSFPVHLQTKSVEIPLNTGLLSHLLDLKDQRIVFTVAIGSGEKESDNVVDDINGERDFTSIELSPGYNLTRPAERHTEFGPRIDVSHAVLEVSTVTKDLRRSRGKRQTKEASCQDNLCCRNSIYITFKEIGWDDWVLAPDGYTAYFCKGDCPHRYKSASTFSGIKGLLHLRKPSVVPGPTCAASGYTYLTLLHYDEDDELVSTNYPEMVVTGCRCY